MGGEKRVEPWGRGEEKMADVITYSPPQSVSAGFSTQDALWAYALMDWGAAGSVPHLYISPRPSTFEMNRLPSTRLSKSQVEVIFWGSLLPTGSQDCTELFMTQRCPGGGLASSGGHW